MVAVGSSVLSSTGSGVGLDSGAAVVDSGVVSVVVVEDSAVEVAVSTEVSADVSVAAVVDEVESVGVETASSVSEAAVVLSGTAGLSVVDDLVGELVSAGAVVFASPVAGGALVSIRSLLGSSTEAVPVGAEITVCSVVPFATMTGRAG